MNTPATRNVCALLQCKFPIVSAGMGGPARSELVSAVTAAGGFGFLGMVRESPALIEQEVAAVRRQGHRSFGVNLIPAATPADLLAEQIATCVDLSVPMIGMFWDLDVDLVARLKNEHITVCWQVGSVDEALAAERAGVDLLIVQGREAGGHVRSTQRLALVLPQITEVVHKPVLAAGGLSSGADLLTALALGAGGVALGTAFLATEESFAHPYHKERLLTATAGDTVLTGAFHINWPAAAPVRVIKSVMTSSAPPTAEAVVAQDGGRSIPAFSTDSPLRSTSGALDKMALYAGTGVGSINTIISAGERLTQIMHQAESLLATNDEDDAASPVCYLQHEQPGFEPLPRDILANVDEIASLLRRALWHLIKSRPDTRATGEEPFPKDAHTYARFVMLLGARDISKRTMTAAVCDEAHAEHNILARLRLVIPRLPEGELKQQLEQLLSCVARRLKEVAPTLHS